MHSVDKSRSSGGYHYRLYLAYALIRHYLTIGRKCALINQTLRYTCNIQCTHICMQRIYACIHMYSVHALNVCTCTCFYFYTAIDSDIHHSERGVSWQSVSSDLPGWEDDHGENTLPTGSHKGSGKVERRSIKGKMAEGEERRALKIIIKFGP